MGPAFPVLGLTVAALRETARGAGPLLRFALPTFAVLLVLAGGLRHAAGVAQTWIDVAVLEALMAVACAVVLTPLTLAAYRLFMLGRETLSSDAIDDFPEGTGPVLALSLAFAVALLPFGDLLRLMEIESALMPGIELAYHAFVVVGVLLYALVLVRTLFLFNYACAGADLNLSLAWRQTAGWRLFGLIALVQAPIAGPALVLDRALLGPLGTPVDFGVWSVWPALLAQALALVAAPVAVAAAGTLAYARIAGLPLPAPVSAAFSEPA
jgi:hypothetical protein